MLFQKELLIKKFNFGASGDPTPVLDEAQSKKWNAMVLELFLFYVFFANSHVKDSQIRFYFFLKTQNASAAVVEAGSEVFFRGSCSGHVSTI